MSDPTSPRQPREVFYDLREALRLPACRAIENLADVLHFQTPRWPVSDQDGPKKETTDV